MKSNILVAANYDGTISTIHTSSSNLIGKIKIDGDNLLAMDISNDD
jgi:hypothetical protein